MPYLDGGGRARERRQPRRQRLAGSHSSIFGAYQRRTQRARLVGVPLRAPLGLARRALHLLVGGQRHRQRAARARVPLAAQCQRAVVQWVGARAGALGLRGTRYTRLG